MTPKRNFLDLREYGIPFSLTQTSEDKTGWVMRSVVSRDQRLTSQSLYSTSTIGILKMFGQVLDKLINNLIYVEGSKCLFIHAIICFTP